MPLLLIRFEITGHAASVDAAQRAHLTRQLALLLGAPSTAVSLTFTDVAPDIAPDDASTDPAATDSAESETSTSSTQGGVGWWRRMVRRMADSNALLVEATVEGPAAPSSSSPGGAQGDSSVRTVADMHKALHQTVDGQSATERLGRTLHVEMRGEVRSRLTSRLLTEAEYAQSLEEQSSAMQALSGGGDGPAESGGGHVSVAAVAISIAVAACNCLLLAALAYRLLRLRKGRVVLATRAAVDPSAQHQAASRQQQAASVDVELADLGLQTRALQPYSSPGLETSTSPCYH